MLRAKVLIVDDEESYRAPLASFLRTKGHEVDTAGNAPEALSLLKYCSGDYDIIFVDQVLHRQDINGIELVRLITSAYPRILSVVLTGWTSTDSGITALRNGAYRYISKSAGVQEIELLIEMAKLLRSKDSESSQASTRTLISQEMLLQHFFRLLPTNLHVPASQLARILYGVICGDISPTEGQRFIAGSVELKQALASLSGKELMLDNSQVSFGEGNQLGDVTVSDVAGGHIIKLTINITNMYGLT